MGQVDIDPLFTVDLGDESDALVAEVTRVDLLHQLHRAGLVFPDGERIAADLRVGPEIRHVIFGSLL